MVYIKVLLATALNAIVVTAAPWAEPVPTPTRALAVRSPGDVGLSNAGLGLDKRAMLIPFIASMPAMILASVTLGWCYRSSFDQACLALMAGTVAMALSYAAVWWFHLVKFERNQWDRESLTQVMALRETRARSTALPEVLTSEASERVYTQKDREYNAWKQELEKERRAWADPLEHTLQVYENHDTVPEVKEKLDEAQGKLDLAKTALDKFTEASEVSTTLKRFRKKKTGTLSKRDVHTLMDEAVAAVDEVEDKVQELLKQNINYLDRLKELPFYKDNDPDSNGMLRRGLDDEMPRLVTETTENCDTQLCRRVWVSRTLPKGRKRGHISARDMIHNIYSTPTDFHFETDGDHRSIIRRDASDEEEDSELDDDDLVVCEDELTLNDHPVISRISLVPGNDTDSLEQMVNSFLQDCDKTEKNFQDAVANGKNMTNFNSETWQCINADGDNGGEWAMRGVGIFTSNATLLHMDTAPLLAHCSHLL